MESAGWCLNAPKSAKTSLLSKFAQIEVFLLSSEAVYGWFSRHGEKNVSLEPVRPSSYFK